MTKSQVMTSTKTNDMEERICELYAAGKSHEEIAEAVSTPGRPLIAYMIKSYLRRVRTRRGFARRESFEEHLRGSKNTSPGEWKPA